MASIARIVDATASDAQTLSDLVFAAAPAMLTELFGAGDSGIVKQFLTDGFRHPSGQFGYANHRVVRSDSETIAVACGWHDTLPKNFDSATVSHIHEFFGFERSIAILERNRLISRWIKPPESHEYAIGHLSVAPEHRRQGIAKLLLSDCVKAALALHKTQVILDVETDNHAAIGCYQSFGFTLLPVTTDSPYVRLVFSLTVD